MKPAAIPAELETAVLSAQANVDTVPAMLRDLVQRRPLRARAGQHSGFRGWPLDWQDWLASSVSNWLWIWCERVPLWSLGTPPPPCSTNWTADVP